MNYNEAIKYIENTSKFGINLGLQRVERILELLDNPHKKLKCIHIAGTNGKGSTTAMINQILMSAGYKVGMFTSPYLEYFEERIQINRKNIPRDDLTSLINQVSKVISKVIGEGMEPPTEFEIITCAAFKYFYDKKVDFAVIEVGLGGRYDSTNVIEPLLSVITSISIDHTKILGNDIKSIAYEKAGIIKKGIPVIIFPQVTEAEEVLLKVCKEKGSPYSIVDEKLVEYCGKKDFNQIIKIKNSIIDGEIEFSLLGKHQLLNCATAITTITELKNQGVKILEQHIIDGLKKVRWAGRMEIVKYKPLTLLDGAHNIDGIKKLNNNLKTYFKYSRLILIIGILADKNVEDMVRTITKDAYKVITVTPNSNRAEIAKELKKVVQKYNTSCESEEDYKIAYNKAVGYSGENDLIVITGSLYMIGDMRKIILQKER